MASSRSLNGGSLPFSSQRLLALAQQLSHYKPPPCSLDDGDEQERIIEETVGKVVSQVGVQESVTPISQNPEKFKPKRAAVLICLFEGDAGDLRVILTKRSSRLTTHSGGKAEEGDKDDIETATREAKEEIGLDPSLVNIVTVLEPFLSKHLLRVVPVIGILTDKKAFKPTPNAAEDENRTEEEREWMGEKYLLHFFEYETEKEKKKYIIWGLTAGVLIRAASLVYQQPPAFLEQNPKFKFPKIDPNHGSDDDVENLFQRLRLYKPTPVSDETQFSVKRAAVLVCIFQGNNGDLRTALREAKEEIGLEPSLVNVVTVLEPVFTKHRMIVVPVVGILSDTKAFDPCPCADEVEAIFDAPLEMFLKDENRWAEEKEWKGEKYLLHYFDYEVENGKYLIWAFTAGVLIRVASIVYQRPPAFLELRPRFWDMAITGDIPKP
ncbi:hypothetical protein CXB51_016002 [Gossypium anomalum]|uniref:Nudix hydrolase domain-containing protein n=1 Tax=Gossypium anomalum TaxID=47600 RepID=A0A8J5Z106_9ROSI|nr:hypothetical protein CXB51_016002 [Gossypium anomalum]